MRNLIATGYVLSQHGDPWAMDRDRLLNYLGTFMFREGHYDQDQLEEAANPRASRISFVTWHPAGEIPGGWDGEQCVNHSDLEKALCFEAHGRYATSPKRTKVLAVMPLMGPITQRASMFSMFFGGTSLTKWVDQFQQFVNSPDVGAVLVQTDSPGGSVRGIEEAGNVISQAATIKPIGFSVDSLMASAAYHLGSQGSFIAASPSSEIGSIGVYTFHADYTQALEQAGIKVTPIFAGENKVELQPWVELSEGAKAAEQAIIDGYYDSFVKAVASGRDVKVATVNSDFGQGRTFRPAEAKKVGMIDRVEAFNATVTRMAKKLHTDSVVQMQVLEQQNELAAYEQQIDLDEAALAAGQ